MAQNLARRMRPRNIDEIHRLDKPKQDFLLPLLENGQIILIGATT